MTALSDIGWSSISKAVATQPLRGSDLADFNNSHPRDAGGRFARVAEAPSKDDPRIARMARLRRRQRRGAAEIAGHQAAVVQAATDASALQGLRRERVLLPRRVVQVIDPRVKANQEAPKETKPEPKVKPHLNDESKARPDDMYKIKTPAYVVVEPTQALEFMLTKSMVVGAANDRWDTDLKAFDWNSLQKHIQSNDLRGKVILEINNGWYTPEGESQLDGVLLSSAQYLSVDTHMPEDLTQIHNKPFLTAKGVTNMPVIPVNADDFDDATYTLRQHPNYRKQPTSKAASAMDWDDADHPRDPDTGQFMRLHTGPGGPPSNPDPRISRERRRRRRQRRGLAEIAASHDVEPQQPESKTLMDVRARSQRPVAQRPASFVVMHERPGLRHQEQGTPKPLPLVRPQAEPEAEETLGPLLHPWVGIDPNVSTLAPTAPRVPKSKASTRVFPKTHPLRETAALGATPRMDLVDEHGNHLNQAEIDAWVKAVRAQRARKARRPTS